MPTLLLTTVPKSNHEIYLPHFVRPRHKQNGYQLLVYYRREHYGLRGVCTQWLTRGYTNITEAFLLLMNYFLLLHSYIEMTLMSHSYQTCILL
jgi:hypothetical protein